MATDTGPPKSNGQRNMSDNEIDETEIDLRLAMLRHWYGDLLSEEQWTEVREGVGEELVEVANAVRAVELGYDDEPLPLFTPYRGED